MGARRRVHSPPSDTATYEAICRGDALAIIGSNPRFQLDGAHSRHARTGPAQRSGAGAFGPAGARLVYISGHDGNLFNVGGLFDLHWNVDGIADDALPDSQIVFELWQNLKSKQYFVRLLYRAQTIDQLRSGEPLTLANPPAEVYLTPPGCTAGRPCPFATFDQAAHAALDPAYIKPDLLPAQTAPPNP